MSLRIVIRFLRYVNESVLHTQCELAALPVLFFETRTIGKLVFSKLPKAQISGQDSITVKERG